MAVSGTALASLISKGVVLGLLSLVVILKGHEYVRESCQPLQARLQPFTSFKSVSVRISRQETPADDQYLAICISVKDQNNDIREWIEHHEQLGVSKFYIVDNDSKIPLLPYISDFVDRGLVQYDLLQEFRHPTNRAQPYVYDRCLAEHGRKHQFIGFIDADEFVVLKNTSCPGLPCFLRQYEAYGGLAINWRLFGSSGHITRPEGGTLQSYTKCNPEWAPVNVHVKTFANTDFAVSSGGDPHHFLYLNGKFAVNEAFEPVQGALSDSISMHHILIQHYVIKSWEDFRGKQLRGSGMGNHRPAHFWDEIEQEATEDCTDLAESRISVSPRRTLRMHARLRP